MYCLLLKLQCLVLISLLSMVLLRCLLLVLECLLVVLHSLLRVQHSLLCCLRICAGAFIFLHCLLLLMLYLILVMYGLYFLISLLFFWNLQFLLLVSKVCSFLAPFHIHRSACFGLHLLVSVSSCDGPFCIYPRSAAYNPALAATPSPPPSCTVQLPLILLAMHCLPPPPPPTCCVAYRGLLPDGGGGGGPVMHYTIITRNTRKILRSFSGLCGSGKASHG
jgi:hypothetical protein